MEVKEQPDGIIELTDLFSDEDEVKTINIQNVVADSQKIYKCAVVEDSYARGRDVIVIHCEDVEPMSIYSKYLIDIFKVLPLPFEFKIVGVTTDNNSNPIPKIEFIINNVFSEVPVIKARAKSAGDVMNAGIEYKIKNIWKAKTKYIFTVEGNDNCICGNETLEEELKKYNLMELTDIYITYNFYYVRKNRKIRFVTRV